MAQGFLRLKGANRLAFNTSMLRCYGCTQAHQAHQTRSAGTGRPLPHPNPTTTVFPHSLSTRAKSNRHAPTPYTHRMPTLPTLKMTSSYLIPLRRNKSADTGSWIHGCRGLCKEKTFKLKCLTLHYEWLLKESMFTDRMQAKTLETRHGVYSNCCPNLEKTRTPYCLCYNHLFWDTLRGVKGRDPEPWLTDAAHGLWNWKWSFHFDGSLVFPISLNPVHMQRRSCKIPVHIVSLQPK
jgi:hypothetical protein